MREPFVFLGVIALLTITPGADMAMVARSVFMGGRRDAFATTLGISAGCVIWALASAAGIAVLAASETAYDTLRLVGAAYLVWLGVQSLLAARRGYHGSVPVGVVGRSGPSPFGQGLLTNLFNPTILRLAPGSRRRGVQGLASPPGARRLTGAVLVGPGIRVAAD